MESLKQLFKKADLAQSILIILFVIFLVMGKPIPRELSNFIEKPIGTILVIGVALSLFAYSNPILAILGVFVAFEMIRRSGALDSHLYMPTEAKKWENIKDIRHVEYTLEQEVIKNMAPVIEPRLLSYFGKDSFKPIVDYTHNAASLV
jgi:hypothetical protein